MIAFGWSAAQWGEVIRAFPPRTDDLHGLLESKKNWTLGFPMEPTGDTVSAKAVYHVEKFMRKLGLLNEALDSAPGIKATYGIKVLVPPRYVAASDPT